MYRFSAPSAVKSYYGSPLALKKCENPVENGSHRKNIFGIIGRPDTKARSRADGEAGIGRDVLAWVSSGFHGRVPWSGHQLLGCGLSWGTAKTPRRPRVCSDSFVSLVPWASWRFCCFSYFSVGAAKSSAPCKMVKFKSRLPP